MHIFKIIPTMARISGSGEKAHLYKVGFGEPAQNDEIVRAVSSRMGELAELNGSLALISGPASLPVAFVLAHGLLHRYGAVAVFDPKLGSYVVVSAHGGRCVVGELIPASLVEEE